LAQFLDVAEEPTVVDVNANEIVARTLRILGLLSLETGDAARAAELLNRSASHFERVNQMREAYRCQAQALEIEGGLPGELLSALAAADADSGCVVEAARLHAADPRTDAPAQHWRGLVTTGAAAAAAREHRWTDRVAV
jgi:hypothetical protein